MGRCFAVLPDARLVLSCGHWDHSLRCTAVDSGLAVQTLRQHRDVVTCLALGAGGEVLVTGSRDTTLMIWGGVQSARKARPGGGKAAPHMPLHAGPRRVLYGHDEEVGSPTPDPSSETLRMAPCVRQRFRVSAVSWVGVGVNPSPNPNPNPDAGGIDDTACTGGCKAGNTPRERRIRSFRCQEEGSPRLLGLERRFWRGAAACCR